MRTWRKLIPVLSLAAAVLLAAAAAPQGFVELFKASTQAHEAKDYKAMEHHLREALKQRPAHPAALYHLAAAQALQGTKDGALDKLEVLARMGLSFDPGQDADFAGLRDERRFTRVGGEFARNRKPVGRATTAFQILNPSFIPEGIAYDQDSGAYFVGGVHERRIQKIGRGGGEQDFVLPGGGLWAPLGLAADSARRLLWVASAAIPQMRNAEPGELGRSAVLAYHLDSGQLKRRHLLPEDGAEHVLGDLIVLRSGTIYVTDAKAGVLYSLNSTSGKFEALTRPGQLASPQGLALARDKKSLYVADRTQGVFRYDIDGGALERLEVAEDICVYGIDGLYRYEDHLVAVQNGIRPHRVVRFSLGNNGRRIRRAYVLAANLPQFDEPTLGVVVGNRFNFVANSQWNRFDKNHQLPPKEQLRSPVILRVSLDEGEDERREPGRGERLPPESPPPRSPVESLPPIRPPRLDR